MRIFLDTANIDEIKSVMKCGVVAGVTTNPSLLAKEGRSDYAAVIKEICGLVAGPVSAEVTSEGFDSIIAEAKKLSAIAPNVVIKIPATTKGLELTHELRKDAIKVNMTLVFSANQAILAALAGAAFVSPFVGRLDDIGHDGMAVVKDIVDIYKTYNFSTEVIAASIRHPLHCIAAAKAGAHIATVPTKVLKQMMEHPLTDVGIARFAADWKGVCAKK